MEDLEEQDLGFKRGTLMAQSKLQVMIGHELDREAKAFIEFLKNVGRKYPVSIRYRALDPGYYQLTIDGSPGSRVDVLLQELILNRGLYYYICSLMSSKKRTIISSVILPLFSELLESRFSNAYTRFLRRHILGKLSQNDFVPGNLHDQFCHEYEILLRKWDIGILDDWNFIKDTDSLLTRFMLKHLGHKAGERSPAFDVLLEQSYAKGLAMAEETIASFAKIHKARTEGLHRLAAILNHDKTSELATHLYLYFSYFDEFQDSQSYATVELNGRRYRRIRYGDEKWVDDATGQHHCGDCAAVTGQYHCEGCDWERCPKCGEQLIGCACVLT